MKRLRILTGKHAGASLDLRPGQHSTGTDHAHDITITDWRFAPLHLVVAEDDQVSARWSESDGAGEHFERQHRFTDFEPRAFGDIVVCLGPVDAEWPTDIQLLDAIFRPTPGRMARWAGARLRARTSVLLGGLLMACAIGTLGLMTAQQADRPAEKESLASLSQRVQQALARTGAPGLKVQPDAAGRLVVVGLVNSTEQARAVGAALQGVAGPVAVVPRVTVAAEVAETIRSSVGLAGAQVKHLGEGRFAFTGETQDPGSVRQAIDRVRADLGDVVSHIDVTLEQADQRPANVPVLSSMKDDEVSVVQTRDGVKHLVVTEPAPTAWVDQALSISPGVSPVERQ